MGRAALAPLRPGQPQGQRAHDGLFTTIPAGSRDGDTPSPGEGLASGNRRGGDLRAGSRRGAGRRVGQSLLPAGSGFRADFRRAALRAVGRPRPRRGAENGDSARAGIPAFPVAHGLRGGCGGRPAPGVGDFPRSRGRRDHGRGSLSALKPKFHMTHSVKAGSTDFPHRPLNASNRSAASVSPLRAMASSGSR